MTDSYFGITEIAGDNVSVEQVQRLTHRYLWAGMHSRHKDVVEAGCGTGAGLTYLKSVASTLEAGDYSQQMVDICRRRLGNSITIHQFDAQKMPFADQSKDVVLLFEAIYYVPEPAKFFAECRRILRPGGRVLIATANKDLYDFNPSPNSHQYLGAVELAHISAQYGMRAQVYGYVATNAVSVRQRVFRPVKKLAVAVGLVPKTNEGKKWLKRLVFGRLIPLPADIDPADFQYVAPTVISGTEPDRIHKVIYCCATLPH